MKRTTVRSDELSRDETRNRLLDVAEQLFAKHGLDAVSVRDITQAANANLGAINYHFGTKQHLVEAVFERRLSPINKERFDALDTAEKSAGSKALKLEDVLEAFIRPAVRHARDPKRGGVIFGKLMGRCMMEPNPELEAFLFRSLEPVARRFDATLMKAMPQLSLLEVVWRMHLTIGALHHSLMMIDTTPPGRPKLSFDEDEYVQRVVTFAAAGFRASVAVARRKS